MKENIFKEGRTCKAQDTAPSASVSTTNNYSSTKYKTSKARYLPSRGTAKELKEIQSSLYNTPKKQVKFYTSYFRQSIIDQIPQKNIHICRSCMLGFCQQNQQNLRPILCYTGAPQFSSLWSLKSLFQGP